MVKVKNKVLIALSILLCAILFSSIFVFMDNTKLLNAETETQSQNTILNHTDDVAKLDEETVVTADDGTVDFPNDWMSQIRDLLNESDTQTNNRIFDERITSIRFSKTTLDGYTELGKLSTGLPVYQKTTVIEATETTEEEKDYDIAFVYSGTIKAPADCSLLFGQSIGTQSNNENHSLRYLSLLEFEDNFDVSGVTTVADFLSCESAGAMVACNIVGFEKLNFTSELKDTSYMFWARGRNYAYTINFSNFNTSGVTTMKCMFQQSSNLKGTEDLVIDVSHLDTSSVIDMSYMFSDCSVNTLNFGANFDTSNVQNMEGIFARSKITGLVFPSTFDTSNVTNMSSMFERCLQIEHINLSGLKTQNVTTMNSMFSGCTNLKNVNLSDLDTTSLLDVSSMFYDCLNLSSIKLFTASNLTSVRSLFFVCDAIEILDLSSLDLTNVTTSRYIGYMISECYGLKRVILPKAVGISIALPEIEDGVNNHYALTTAKEIEVTEISSELIENNKGSENLIIELFDENNESLIQPTEPATGVNASLIAVLCSVVAVIMIAVSYVIISNNKNSKRKVNAINIDNSKRK